MSLCYICCRKMTAAQAHHRKQLLGKCMVAWQLFVTQQQNKRALESMQQQTKSKMAAFLDAAASGKLWSDGQELRKSRSLEDVKDCPDSTREKVVSHCYFKNIKILLKSKILI